MRVVVDTLRCSSIGICESIAPDYFEIGPDGALILHREIVDPGDEGEVREAVRACPAVALSILEEDG